MSNDFAYLESLEGSYESSEAATSGRIPNGRYQAILNQAKLYPPDEKRPYPRFSVSFVIMDGPYAGRFLYMDWGFTEKGFPYFKQFTNLVGVQVPHLRELPDRLAEYSGKICQLSVQDDRNDPRYQRTYLDRYIGMGNVSDYLKPKNQQAVGAADESFEPLPDEDDVPF